LIRLCKGKSITIVFGLPFFWDNRMTTMMKAASRRYDFTGAD
jgi:hypothetical protein